MYLYSGRVDLDCILYIYIYVETNIPKLSKLWLKWPSGRQCFKIVRQSYSVQRLVELFPKNGYTKSRCPTQSTPFWKFSSILSSWPQCRQKTTKQISRAVRVKNGDWTLQNICVSSFSMLIYAYLLKYHWKNAETPETTKRNKQLFNCSRFKFVSIAGIPISVAKSTFCGHMFMSFAQSVGREHHQKLGLSQLASHVK